MAELTFSTKLSLVITSTRSEAFLRNRLANTIWPAMRDAMVDALNADAETTHLAHEISASVHYYAGDTQAEINARGSITVETTRTLAQLRAGFDAVLDDWKLLLRDEIQSDAQTSLGGVDYPDPFHVHRSTGSGDEAAP